MTDVTPIRYHLRFPEPASHYVEVEATFPTGGLGELELFLAVWTPGSYLVREYSRHLESMTSEAAIEKIAKNRWRLRKCDGASCTVRYRVYCREMSVRTNWVEHDFALLNGAPTFLTTAGQLESSHEVRLDLPPHWSRAVTALPVTESGAFAADSFDTLIDSPVLCGTPTVREFTVSGRTHILATVGDGGLFDHDRAVGDLQQVIATQHALWKVVPYDRYVFLNVLTEAGGGLEHKNSTVLMGSRYVTRSRGAYLGNFQSEPARHGWLGLASHEFFHVWNGKRLRPVELGPFNFEAENYTGGLWFVEGVTSYYDDLILARTGLLSEDEYLASLSQNIERLQTTPGRSVRSVELSSFDAWIREYRPDENSVNATISYYVKGAVVAFLLDMEIRRATRGTSSLDDALRVAFPRFSGARGYTRAGLLDVINEVAATSLTAWLDHALTSMEELNYGPALDWLGLQFAAPESSNAPWLGVTTRVDNGRLLVANVLRASPATQAGINVDDEIIAMNGFRVRPDQWALRLEEHRPGDVLDLLIARRDQVRELRLQAAATPVTGWKLQPDPLASYEQIAQRRDWLSR